MPINEGDQITRSTLASSTSSTDLTMNYGNFTLAEFSDILRVWVYQGQVIMTSHCSKAS